MSGVSRKADVIRPRSRGVIATAVAMVLLAPLMIRAASAEDVQEYPVTAADASRMTSIPSDPVAVASPPSRAMPAARTARIQTSSPRAEAPITKAEPAYYDPAAIMMSAPIASAPLRAMPASAPSPVAIAPAVAAPAAVASAVVAAPIEEPAPEASPAVEAALPPVSPDDDERDALARPTFTTPAIPPINNSGDDARIENPEMQEIPRAIPGEPAQPAQPKAQANAVPEVDDLNAYINYDASPQGLGSPGEYTAEGEEVSPIGLEMHEAHRRLKTGETAGGLLILKVEKDSAAARAGLHPYRRAGHTVLEGIAIGAAMVFPPAILAVPVIDYTEVGESYDMIIGVDGSRVCNVLDFEDRMRNIQPGETVYFNVVRNGRRIQVPVPIPALSTAASP